MKKLCFAVLLLAAGVACALAQAQTSPASQVQTPPAMKTWFVRLIPPRPTFMQDMTEGEQKLMQEHFVYLKDLYSKGICIFGGPVLDPKGVYGVLVFAAATEDEARSIASADPSVKAGLNRIEVAEMRVAFPPKTQ
ncbi:MAG: YciI family protein [Terracidiphilus sp.]